MIRPAVCPFNELRGHAFGGRKILFLEVAEFARDTPRRPGPIILDGLCRRPWNPAFRLGYPSRTSIAHDQSRQARNSQNATVGTRLPSLPTSRRPTNRALPERNWSACWTNTWPIWRRDLPPREKLLAEHPALASQLEPCLSGIEFIRSRPAQQRIPRHDSATLRSSARSAEAGWAWSMKPSSSRSSGKWPSKSSASQALPTRMPWNGSSGGRDGRPVAPHEHRTDLRHRRAEGRVLLCHAVHRGPQPGCRAGAVAEGGCPAGSCRGGPLDAASRRGPGACPSA